MFIYAPVWVAGEVSVAADFFLLGGDSLRAGRCIAALRKEFGVELKVG